MTDIILASRLVYDAVLFATALYAITCGGSDERIGIAIAIVASALSAVVMWVSAGLGVPGRFGCILIDLGTLLAFDWVMVRSVSFWPLWATGIQVATVFIDLSMIVSPVGARPFTAIQGKFAYPVLLSIALGTYRRQRLLRTNPLERSLD